MLSLSHVDILYQTLSSLQNTILRPKLLIITHAKERKTSIFMIARYFFLEKSVLPYSYLAISQDEYP